eukprot:8280660-Pyramimonas_sp.AAC.1
MLLSHRLLCCAPSDYNVYCILQLSACSKEIKRSALARARTPRGRPLVVVASSAGRPPHSLFLIEYICLPVTCLIDVSSRTLYH